MNSRLSTPFFEQKIRKWRTNERQKFIVSSFLVAFVRRVNGIELNVGCVVGCVDGGRQQKWTWKQLWNASTATERPSTRRNHIVVIHRLWFECGRSEQQQKKPTRIDEISSMDGNASSLERVQPIYAKINIVERKNSHSNDFILSWSLMLLARTTDDSSRFQLRILIRPFSILISPTFSFFFNAFPSSQCLRSQWPINERQASRRRPTILSSLRCLPFKPEMKIAIEKQRNERRTKAKKKSWWENSQWTN